MARMNQFLHLALVGAAWVLPVHAFVSVGSSNRPSSSSTTSLGVALPDAAVLVDGASSAALTVSGAAAVLEELPVGAKLAAVLAPILPSVATFVRSATIPEPVAPTENTYPEASAATYELSDVKFPMELGDAALVRPLMKQTQLEYRRLKVAFDANADGYNAKKFHRKVDGKGAAIVLCKAKGKWFGGYNPRGWASLGGSRPSRAAFLFYEKGGFSGGWQKLRAVGGGGMACGNDLFDNGIFMGAEALVAPLDGANPRVVKSRLGTYFEGGPDGRSTLLPIKAVDTNLQELKVLVGVYEDDEDIPNSGGVLDLGLY